MIIAHEPIQRPPDARLLAIDARGTITHRPRSRIAALLRRDDLVVGNDAATLPASLTGIHVASGKPIEVRLAQRRSLDPDDVHDFSAIVFGEGDYRTPTEHRPLPPALSVGHALQLGPLQATVRRLLGHPRFVALRLEGSAQAIWRGIARHGRPIQYAHMHRALELWDVWTPIAAAPAAFEPPSAGFALDWHLLSALRRRGVRFATITHAAGISSTGDAALDGLLPLDEPYRIPRATADAIAKARRRGGRIVAIGTTVVRALEAAATDDGLVAPGAGIATQRIDQRTRLRVVDVIVSGTHQAGTSHYALLGAFAARELLEQADRELDAHGYRTHEFGDSVLIERSPSLRSDGSLHRPCRQAAHDRALREEEQHERG